MPHCHLSREDTVPSITLRRKKLEKLREENPQLAEIYDFYVRLYAFLEGEQSTYLAVLPGGEHGEARRREGFPLLSGERLRPAPQHAAPFLGRLIEELKTLGRQGQQELADLQQALATQQLDLAVLFRACLDRERRPLEEEARRVGVSPPLLEFVFDTALSFALQRAGEEGLSAPTEGWTQGYCPLCGGLPVMGELCGEEGRRRLHCGTCATAWPYPRIKCVYCGNSETGSLEYFTAEGDTGYRVDICRKCSCYLKTVDSRERGEDLPMDVEDLHTLHLDLLAQREGFTKGKRLQGDAGEQRSSSSAI